MNNLGVKTREDLKQISAEIKPLLPMTGFSCVNEALKNMYEIPEEETLDTFQGWKKKGYSVKKGEHAFTFWSAPLKSKKAQEQQAEEKKEEQETDDKKMFGICKLFASCQVEKMEARA